jgi:GntR family transcriptional regulator
VKGESLAIILPAPLYYGTAAPMTQTGRPIYLKLRDLIAAAILDGTYAEGEMLPSVRALAAQQGANPLTVAKAYQQFQLDGLIDVQRGVGMIVASGAAEKLRKSERLRFLTDEWPALRAKMHRLEITAEELFARS